MDTPLDDTTVGRQFPNRAIRELREGWVEAITKQDWTLAALYQIDIEKARDQRILSEIGRSEDRIIKFMIFGAVVAIGIVALRLFV